MSDINKYDEKFEVYELINNEGNSSIKVCPERGGIITSFKVKGEEVFYLDEDTFYDEKKNIRGGNPILFPLCGQLPDQKYKLNDKEYTMKNHGLARINKWHVIDSNVANDTASITIKFESNDETLESFPFEFEVIFEYILSENKLTINQQYINKSQNVMPVSAGFHPYFNAKDKKSITYDVNANSYFDNEDKMIKNYFLSPIDLTNSDELKMLLDNKGNTISFNLEDISRKITFEYSDEFKYIVLWSTPESKFVCVEPWTSKIGALYSGEDLLKIKPGENLRLTFSIKVD